METMELQTIEIPEFLPVTKQSGIEKAETYAATFAPFMITVKELSEKVVNLNKDNPTLVDAKLAREVRLALVKNRTATAKKKDESKAALLAEGNLIQNLHNVVINTSQLIEAELESVEKFAENKEKERIEALRNSRADQLSPFVTDASIFPLGEMSEDAFTELLTGSKLAHEAKIQAEKEAEEARIKEENARLEEQKRIREENERLKKEAEAKEKKLEKERAEQAAKLKAIADENKAAREKAAKEHAEREAKAAAELKAQKDAADNLASQLKAKEDAEKKAAAEKLAAEKKAAKAPVKEKIQVAINGLSLVLPESEVTDNIMEKFNGFKQWALSQAESL